MARKPRKVAAEVVEKKSTGKYQFGEPVPFTELPPKQSTDESFRQIEGLEANTMLRVQGATIKEMRAVARKVIKAHEGRVYDYRLVDVEDESAGVNVYRIS